MCKQLSVAAPVQEQYFEAHLNGLRSTMGVMQHHDAVTGTEKQHVANDYSRMLSRSIAGCGANIKSTLNQLTTGKRPQAELTNQRKAKHPPPHADHLEFEFASCLGLNISDCATTERANQFTVTVYNPLAHATYQYVRFPITGEKYEVRDYRNIEVPAQIIPVPKSIQSLDFRQTSSKFELVFRAEEVPSLGYKTYYVNRIGNELTQPREPEVIHYKRDTADKKTVIGNEQLNVTFDVNGLLSEIAVDGVRSKLSHNFVYYVGAIGDNETFEKRSSGAYIFRPDPKSKEQIVSKQAKIEVFRGEHVDEVSECRKNAEVAVLKSEKILLTGPSNLQRVGEPGRACVQDRAVCRARMDGGRDSHRRWQRQRDRLTLLHCAEKQR